MDNNNTLKRIIIPVLACFFLMLVSGCSPKNAKSLVKMAKRQHGYCTVVSKTETDDGAKVVLHDKLQDFDYTVSSYMSSIDIDGSHFGSVPDTGDDFERKLAEKVLSNVQSDLETIYNETGTEQWDGESNTDMPVILASDEQSAKEATERVAEALQEQNLNNRMDGWQIMAYKIDNDKISMGYSYWHLDRYGSVTLPSTTFRNPEEEKIDTYTKAAQQLDKNAVFLRKEKKTFAYTGLDLDKVVNNINDDPVPESDSSPVTLYFFRASDGLEFWVADFFYIYDDNKYGWQRATNYPIESK